MGRLAETFLVFLRLGLTSFGGPVAHLGYFHDEFVTRRKWLSEAAYADLVALCQFLPGPASSQVGIAIGNLRAGILGAVAAWLGFTLPSVLLLALAVLGVSYWNSILATGLLHGLKLAALAVVAQAVWQMASKLTPDWPRRGIALVAAALTLFIATPFTPPAIILLAAIAGILLSPRTQAPVSARFTVHPAALASLIAFGILLVALPLANNLTGDPLLGLLDRFYRTGSLVFGGGHVVLPLLQGELVTPGLIDPDAFVAGYGVTQALPGPLFSFAFYAGALLKAPPNGVIGGTLALLAIYLPSFLLVLGALPFWDMLKALPRLRAALDLANAAVVGLLLAALYDPIFVSAVFSPLDVIIAAAALAALFFRAPPWLVVIACAGMGAVLHTFGL